MTITNIVNKPNKFLSIKMEDECYRVTIQYLDTTYPEDKASGNIQPDAIMIGIRPKPGYPDIRFILKTDVTHQNIGIDMTEVGYISIGAMDEYLRKIQSANECITSIKEVIREYFPGVLKEAE